MLQIKGMYTTLIVHNKAYMTFDNYCVYIQVAFATKIYVEMGYARGSHSDYYMYDRWCNGRR